MDAMLPLRPFIPASRPTPGLDKIALCIEHHHWRRGHGRLIGWQRSRPMQNPHTILCVDADAGSISELPLRRHLRPGGIYLKRRQTARSRRGRLSCSRCAQEPLPFHTSNDDRCHQNGTTQNFALHGVLLNGAKDLPAEISLSNDHDSLLRLAITRPKAHSNPPTRKETRAVTSPNLDPTNTFVTASETKPEKNNWAQILRKFGPPGCIKCDFLAHRTLPLGRTRQLELQAVLARQRLPSGRWQSQSISGRRREHRQR